MTRALLLGCALGGLLVAGYALVRWLCDGPEDDAQDESLVPWPLRQTATGLTLAEQQRHYRERHYREAMQARAASPLFARAGLADLFHQGNAPLVLSEAEFQALLQGLFRPTNPERTQDP